MYERRFDLILIATGVQALLQTLAAHADPAGEAYRHAHACLTSNRFAEAAALFERAAASTNRTAAAAAWLGRGEALYGARRWDDAIRAYDAALEACPDSPLIPNALCGRGFAEAQADRLSEALATFTLLAARYPDHALAGTAAASTGTLSRTLAARSRQKASEALSGEIAAINALAQNGGNEEASRSAERVLRSHPDIPQAAALRLLAADCALRSRDPLRASAAFRDFLDRHPHHDQAPRAWFGLGQALAALGRHAEAADAFGAARNHAEAAPFQAENLIKAGRTDEALQLCTELARCSSNAAVRARATLMAGDCRAARKEWEAAERAFLSVEVLQAADELRPVALARLVRLYDGMGLTNRSARARGELARRYPDFK